MDFLTLVLTFVVILISTFVYFYFKIILNHNYWKKRKVPFLQPSSLLFGSDKPLVTGEFSSVEHYHKLYNDLAPHKFAGIFSFQNPVLVARDPELIKQILTRDFDSFYDRSFYLVNRKEPLTFHLFNLCGDEWKLLRAKMTPTFTSGKMKAMFPFVKECGEELLKVIGKSDQIENLEMKDLMARYTTDVIASCAFGVQANSLNDPNSEFKRLGRQSLTPTLRTRIRDFVFAMAPKYVQRLGLRSFDNEVTEFFNRIVREMVKYRDENNVTRKDFLNLVMQMRNENLAKTGRRHISEGIINQDNSVEFTLELLTAQCFVIFLGGFETSSSTISFALFELSQHKDVQRKMQEEIDRVLQKYDGEVTHEVLQEMTYMDQVLAEVTRKYPVLAFLLRTCTKDYEIPGSDITLDNGTLVFIPIYGIHHDPTYYSDPFGFNPDHFSEEAKAARPSYTHLPFGDGPRMCIGMKFGIMQMKLALALLLKNYEFSLSPKMEVPLKFVKHTIVTNSEGGILLTCKKRST